MKVPDKLYIGRRNYGPLIGGWKSQPFTSKEIESIEYIRKDVLMEWARELNEAYHKEYEESNYTCGEHWGQMVAFQKIVDKLNSI